MPRPGCRCRVCVEARVRGVPYARTGPSVFVHGPDVLIDTPEESKQQLNRSQVGRIAAGFYSHWHPDHTAGRRVWEARNFDFRSFPPRAETTPVYVPVRVWADFEEHHGLAEQFRFLERQGTIAVRLVAEQEPFDLGDVRVTPIPLDAENAHAFLFEGDGKRLLIAMDETHGWMPPDLGPLDLAVLPIGVFEHHPFTGERLIPEEFCKPPVRKTRYATALEQARRLGARHTVLSHIEEMDRMSHDDLLRLGAADGWQCGAQAADGGLVHEFLDEGHGGLLVKVALKIRLPHHLARPVPSNLGRDLLFKSYQTLKPPSITKFCPVM